MSAALRLDGELTIYGAADLKPQLLTAIVAGAATAVDLSEVTEIDTAGVQLLLLARREAASLGGELRLIAPSPAVCEAFSLLALTAHFDSAAAAV